MGQDENGNPSTWVKGAVWALGLGVPFIVGGLVLIGQLDRDRFVERYSQVDRDIEQLAIAVSILREGLATEKENTVHTKRECAHMQRRIESNTVALSEVGAVARNRPDKFTGTEGRILRGIIDAVERRVDLLEQRCPKPHATTHYNGQH